MEPDHYGEAIGVVVSVAVALDVRDEDVEVEAVLAVWLAGFDGCGALEVGEKEVLPLRAARRR